MPIRAKTLQVAALCCATLLSSGLHAEGIDTEHIFAFMIGADVGTFGEREFQSQTTGRFGRNGGRYRSLGQELELIGHSRKSQRAAVCAFPPGFDSIFCFMEGPDSVYADARR